jgi:hypothetical protein
MAKVSNRAERIRKKIELRDYKGKEALQLLKETATAKFDESAEVTIDEMTLLLKSTMSGLCKFCGIAPPDERRLEMMSQTAFSAIQKDKDNALTRDEFLDYCDRTPEIRAWLAHFDDAVDLCDDIKYQMDSDVDHEFDYFAERKALIDALKEDGSGTLIDTFHGTQKVNLLGKAEISAGEQGGV